MQQNAYILDWTMDEYEQFRSALSDRKFVFVKEKDSEHIRVAVPYQRVEEFASLVQLHLNASFNYVDLQFPEQKRTVIVFKERMFVLTSRDEDKRAKDWAITIGLPPKQANWSTSF